MTKKYELTEERNAYGLYRIRALRDIPVWGVREGDLGGWVEGEHNLSQEGNAWVYGDARVYSDAQIYGNARVLGDAQIYGDAWVYGDARVLGNARVYGNARVLDNALVYGDAEVGEPTHVTHGNNLPSGDWTLFRTTAGHALRIGCWGGTTADLRALIAHDHGWPEATGEQITQRRPILNALAGMCDAVITSWKEMK